METLLQLLRKTTAFLQNKGVENARLDAELLFAHVLGCRRLDLYLQFERPLDEQTLGRLRPLVARRGKREPLQYITGEAAFRELRLRADRRALIPRPETEELVERVEALAGATPRAILDLGTGSGVLALALAQAYPEASVTAADSCAEALALARENAGLNGLSERVAFRESDWFAGLRGGGPFEIIVSNPPYLSEAQWQACAPEVRAHEPKAALVAGEDGLRCLKTILAGALDFLAPGGLLALETGPEQHEPLAAEAGGRYAEAWGECDLSGRPRFFFARRV